MTFRSIIIISALSVILSGCNSQADINRRQKEIEATLPAGCKISYHGDYLYGNTGSIPVIIVRCNQGEVVNTLTTVQHGKTNHPQLNAVVEN